MVRSLIEFEVPTIVRAKAAAAPGGRSWVRALPQVVADLERAWSITVIDVLPGGTASVVARVVTRDGLSAVLKIAVPGTGFSQQVRTLSGANGDGYVRLLDHDPRHEAVLLEALGRSMQDCELDPSEQLVIVARLLRRSWRLPDSVVHGEPQNKAVALAEAVSGFWRDLDRPCPAAVVELALHCAGRRAEEFDPAACVVLHGDAATANAARVLHQRPGSEDGFVLLDPESFIGDPAYDLGVALRDWCAELLAAEHPAAVLGAYCEALAREAVADPVAVWEWGYLERVSTGLYALSLGAREQGAAHLRTAEALLADA